MDDETILNAEVELSEQAKHFIEKNPIGRYLVGCAEQDLESARSELLQINPFHFDSLEKLQSAIRDAQERARLARKVTGYLAEAIARGQDASQKLDELEGD